MVIKYINLKMIFSIGDFLKQEQNKKQAFFCEMNSDKNSDGISCISSEDLHDIIEWTKNKGCRNDERN